MVIRTATVTRMLESTESPMILTLITPELPATSMVAHPLAEILLISPSMSEVRLQLIRLASVDKEKTSVMARDLTLPNRAVSSPTAATASSTSFTATVQPYTES